MFFLIFLCFSIYNVYSAVERTGPYILDLATISYRKTGIVLEIFGILFCILNIEFHVFNGRINFYILTVWFIIMYYFFKDGIHSKTFDRPSGFGEKAFAICFRVKFCGWGHGKQSKGVQY